MITATRTRAIGSELTNEDADRAARRGVASSGRILILDDVVLVRVAAGHVLHVDLEPVRLQVVDGHLLVLADLVGDGRRAWTARDRDGDGGALRRLSTAVGALIRDDALWGRVRRGVRGRDRESRLLKRRRRVVLGHSDDAWDGNLLGPSGDVEDDLRPLDDLLAGGWILRDDLPDRFLGEDLVLRRRQVGIVQRLYGVAVVHPDHVRDGRLWRPRRDEQRHAVAFLDPVARVRVLVEHAPLFDVGVGGALHLRVEPLVPDQGDRGLLLQPDDVRHGDGLVGGELVLDLREDVPAGDTGRRQEEQDQKPRNPPAPLLR